MEYNELEYKCPNCGQQSLHNKHHIDANNTVYDLSDSAKSITVTHIPAVKCNRLTCDTYRYSIFVNKITYSRAFDMLESLISNIYLNSNLCIEWVDLLSIALLTNRDSRRAAFYNMLDLYGVKYNNGV